MQGLGIRILTGMVWEGIVKRTTTTTTTRIIVATLGAQRLGVLKITQVLGGTIKIIKQLALVITTVSHIPSQCQ